MVRIKRTSRAKQVEAEIGQRVRDRRILLEMTQQELAAKVGITYQQIQKYEGGTDRISVSRLLDIAAALKIDPCSFIKGIGEKNKMPKPQTKDGARLMSAYGDMDKGSKRQLLGIAEKLAKTATK